MSETARCEIEGEDEMEEHYAVDDAVLPMLELGSPVEIRLDVDESGVTLRVGPRDWHWKRGCPDTDGAGTMLMSNHATPPQCEHGISLMIVCPTCEETLRLREAVEEHNE